MKTTISLFIFTLMAFVCPEIQADCLPIDPLFTSVPVGTKITNKCIEYVCMEGDAWHETLCPEVKYIPGYSIYKSYDYSLNYPDCCPRIFS